jgi:hypothetical protein
VSRTVGDRQSEAVGASPLKGAGIAGHWDMRLVLAVLITLIASGSSGAQPVLADRPRVIAVLEQLLETGEPRHASHDQGEWLQGEVDRAFAVNDVEIMRLAQRAAAPIVARVDTPASAIDRPLQLTISTDRVLQLRTPPDYSAELWATADDYGPFRLGALGPDRRGVFDARLPVAAHGAGLHHLRIEARVTFRGRRPLPPEIRQLPDILYARYDPAAKSGIDAHVFISQAAAVSAQRLDGSLPAIAFESWLSSVITSRAGEFNAGDWRTTYCEERVGEGAVKPLGRAICAVADFVAMGAKGTIWIRTGRLDSTDADVRWHAERPVFQGMRLRGREYESLASLPGLLSTPADDWPSGDVSVAPEEMTISVNREAVRLNAIVRNNGSQPLLRVRLVAGFGTGRERGIIHQLVVDIPPHGSKDIEVEFPLVSRYGVVVLQALQIGGEHGPFESWSPDPTPEDSVAFRIVNPRQAPRDYVDWARKQCRPCRGF